MSLKLHVFNPEHDIALATNVVQFTPPHAARSLRAELGFLPALWADEGDWVLVDDAVAARSAVRKFSGRTGRVSFVTPSDLANLAPAHSELTVSPWGWDSALCRKLLACCQGLRPVLPSPEILTVIRLMSNRRFAAKVLLHEIIGSDSRLVGRSRYYDGNATLIDAVVADFGGRAVLKAPWSSSGRGIRYVEGGLTDYQLRWAANIIQRQGGIMVEPYYNKVKDFAMEFWAEADGTVSYRGLSLFTTVNGAYSGNLLAPEALKEQLLAPYVGSDLLCKVRDEIVRRLNGRLRGAYCGPFGIDMMIVEGEQRQGFLLHPCVEMNLRRTMGHAALALTPAEGERPKVMTISFDGHYHLRLRPWLYGGYEA